MKAITIPIWIAAISQAIPAIAFRTLQSIGLRAG
jgi:hypothetical protein